MFDFNFYKDEFETELNNLQKIVELLESDKESTQVLKKLQSYFFGYFFHEKIRLTFKGFHTFAHFKETINVLRDVFICNTPFVFEFIVDPCDKELVDVQNNLYSIKYPDRPMENYPLSTRLSINPIDKNSPKSLYYNSSKKILDFLSDLEKETVLSFNHMYELHGDKVFNHLDKFYSKNFLNGFSSKNKKLLVSELNSYFN